MTATCPTCAAPLPENGTCLRCLVRVCLATPPATTAGEMAMTDLPAGAQLGDYELLEVLGRGGMGVVYKARQTRLGRVVAVKTILAERLFSPESTRRFRSEAEALAGLRHPNIVGVYELAESEGRQFLVMEYVAGPTLATWMREQPVTAEDAARCVGKLAAAMAYAHERGILHRDLKPSNILVDEHGEPRITDFGLARRMNGDEPLTATVETLGSPQFMSPEQVSGRHGPVGPHSDVYALGAVLYCLLAGRPPFAGATLAEILLKVARENPLPPSRVSPRLENGPRAGRKPPNSDPAPPIAKGDWPRQIPADLETICLKCLEKEPSRRYASAQCLADDLGRFLRVEPTHARPLGPGDRLTRWARRQPALAALAVVSVLALLAVATSLAVAERRVSQREELVRRNAYVVDIHLAQQAIQGNDLGNAIELLERHDPGNSRGNGATDHDLRGWEWHYLWNLCRSDELATLGRHENSIRRLEFSPDGKRVYSADRGNVIHAWEIQSRALLGTYRHPNAIDSLNDLAVSPDGRWLALVGERLPAFLLDADTLRPPDQALTDALNGRSVFFSRDSETLTVLHGDYRARYDIRSRRLKSQDTLNGGHRFSQSANSDLLVAALGNSGRVVRVGLAGASDVPLYKHGGYIGELVLSRDERWLATASIDATTALLDLRGERPPTVLSAQDSVLTVDFSPDGQRVVNAGGDQSLRLWNTNGQPLTVLRGHRSSVSHVRFAPRGDLLASGDGDGFIKLWSTHASPPPTNHFVLSSAAGSRRTMSSDFTMMVSEFDGTNYLVGNPATFQFSIWPKPVDLNTSAIRLSADGQWLARESTNGWIRLYRMTQGTFSEQAVLPGTNSFVRGFAFSPDARILAVDRYSHAVELWDTASARLLATVGHHPQRPSAWPGFSSDGKQLVLGFPSGHVEIVHVPSRAKTASWRAHSGGITAVCFSPSGRWLATSADDGHVRLWEMPGLRRVVTLVASNARVPSLFFTPDERRLFAGTDEGHIKIWDLETFHQLATLPGGGTRFVVALGFAPDGQTLISCSGLSRPEIRRWPAPWLMSQSAKDR